MAGRIDAVLAEKGIELPRAMPAKEGHIEGWALSRGQLYVSGMIPQWNGERRFIGKAGQEFDLAQVQEAARLSALNVLAQASSDLNRVSGITPSMRAVMETLYPDTEMTVPAIARLQRVSRQHIQLIVKDLLAAELLDTHDNPAHKRSKLVRLTTKGEAAYDELRAAMLSLCEEMAADMDAGQIETARAVLDNLARKLSTG